MICKNCNATIPDNVHFCPRCGEKVEAAPAAAAPVFSSAFRPAGDLGGGDLGETGPVTKIPHITPVIPIDTGFTPVIQDDPPTPSITITPPKSYGTSIEEAPSNVCSCGAKLRPGVKFCPACGKPCTAGSTPRPPVVPPYVPPVTPMPGYGGSTALQLLKNLFTSGLFLVATVAFSCYVLCSIFGAASGGSSIISWVKSYLYQAGVGYIDGGDQLISLLNMLQGGSLLGAIISTLPAILVCVGLWITYISAADRATSSMATSGLTIIKVVNTIQMVFADIGLGATLLGLLIALGSLHDYEDAVAGLLVVVVVLIGVIAVVNLYYGKINQTINTAKRVINTGEGSDKVSSFIAVICYITGGLTAVSALIALFGSGIWIFIANAGYATALICFGALIFSFRDKMRNLSLIY